MSIKKLGNVKGVLVITITLLLVLYFMRIMSSSTMLGDEWVLSGIEVETFTFVILLLLLSYKLFKSPLAGALYYSVIIIFLIVLIPVLKYPNSLNIYGPWDSAAHYSFAKWLISHGKVPSMEDDIYYAFNYGYHPGNGVNPAFLSLVTDMSLGSSMNIILAINYVVYVLMLYSSLKSLPKIDKFFEQKSFLRFATLAVLLLLPRFSPYYTGLHIAWFYGGVLVYMVLVRLMNRLLSNRYAVSRSDVVLSLLFLLGLFLTHLSSYVVYVTFLVIMTILSGIARKPDNNGSLMFKLFQLLLIMQLIILITYELYVDIIVFGRIAASILRLRGVFELYEIGEIRRVSETFAITLPDIVRVIIGGFTSLTVIYLIFLIQLFWAFRVLTKSKWDGRVKVDSASSMLQVLGTSIRMQISLLIASIVNIIVLKELLTSVWRIVPYLQFLMSINFALLIGIKKPHRNKSKVRNLSFIPIFLILITLLITTNYDHSYVNPTIKHGDEEYKVISNGYVSQYVLEALQFLNVHVTGVDCRFLAIYPYVTFGLNDLLWNINHKTYVSTRTPEEVIAHVQKSYIEHRYRCIIPMPLSDTLYYKLGQKSYYHKPFETFIDILDVVYHNGNYALLFA